MVKARSEYFWTDAQQASDRLNRTVICYDNQPHYVDIVEHHDDGIPRARIRPCSDRDSAGERKMLNSPKFKRFRDLPRLGWVNSANPSLGAVFLARRLTAGGRSHGLSNGNVLALNFDFVTGGNPIVRSGNYSFTDFIFDKGFCDSHNRVFPSLDKILSNIKPNTAIAFTPLFCVLRTSDGIRWLYRETEKVGIFTGVDTLFLTTKFAYLREEIMSEPFFTLNNLREF